MSDGPPIRFRRYAVCCARVRSPYGLHKLGSILIPVSALNVFNTGIIVIMLPIVDRVIYPCLNRCAAAILSFVLVFTPPIITVGYRMGWQPTMLRKVGFGFFLALLSVIVAG